MIKQLQLLLKIEGNETLVTHCVVEAQTRDDENHPVKSTRMTRRAGQGLKSTCSTGADYCIRDTPVIVGPDSILIQGHLE
jgi:hypothetical protein